MEVSVIIVTKNQKELLEKTIKILKSQNFKGKFEIIIADSGSTDGSIDYYKKEHLKIVNINPDDFNFAHAFNKAAKIARGKYLIRLSGDCIPIKNNFILEIVKPFDNSKVGGTFGKYILSGQNGYGYPDFWPAQRFPKALTTYSLKPFWFMGVNFILPISLGKNVYEFAGGCCAIRHSIWKMRPFNENLIAGEDAEYSWFLHLIGYDIVYNPKAVALHEHKINLIKTSKNYLGINTWSFIFSINIWNFWLKKMLGSNPYKNMVYKP